MKKTVETCPTCGQKIKKPRPKVPESDVTRLKTEYVEHYTAVFGKEPIMAFGRDMKALKDLLAVREYEYLSGLIPQYFQSQDSFLQKMGFDIPRFISFVKSQDVEGGNGQKNGGNGRSGRINDRAREMLGIRRGNSGCPAPVHQSAPGNLQTEQGRSRGCGPVETRLDTPIIEGSCVEIK
jgi:hypothetical protein